MSHTIKASIRDSLATLLCWAGTTAFSRYPKSTITLVTFHRVLPESLRLEYPIPGLAVTPDELRWVLDILAPNFDIRTVTDAHTALVKKDHVKPLLAITFDDGQFDNLKFAAPILTAYSLPATFYVPTAYIGMSRLLWHDEAGFAWRILGADQIKALIESNNVKLPNKFFTTAKGFINHLKSLGDKKRNKIINCLNEMTADYPGWSRLMTWDEVIYLKDLGHEIGSHGRTHSLLSQQTPEQQKKELVNSYYDIKNSIGFAPDSFCYPDGNYNEVTLEIMKNGIYKTAVTTKPGKNLPGADPLQLCRFDINSHNLRNRKGNLSQSRFQLRMSSYQPGV